MHNAARTIAENYDRTPYTSRPFPQTHPQRLAALAALFGLDAPAVEKARVLELGSASGGNIIPLAAAFPDAEFTGIDLSPVQIADGEARIARLGLKNIRLKVASIGDITRGFGTFDYIICHGVYSWVPGDIQDAILRTIHDNLSSNGVGYVSYNVFPGWRLRTVLRDAMMFHTEETAVPGERVAQARDFLNQLSGLTSANSPYGQLLRQEAKGMTEHEDSYVTHEYLELNNDPCYFSEFLRRARLFDLVYLTETDLHLTLPENFGAETGQLLRRLSGNRLDRAEQYIDFLTGRTFRQTLLVKAAHGRSIERTLTPARLKDLHLSSRVAPRFEERDGRYVFTDAQNRMLTTPSAAVRDAVLRLARAFPLSVAVNALTGLDETGEVLQGLFTLVTAGMADVATTPVVAADTNTSNPEAPILARDDAQSGRFWTTNARCETVSLDVVQRAILPLLDGHHGPGEIVAAVQNMTAAGQISFSRNGEPIKDQDEIDAAIAEHVAQAFVHFERAAILPPRAA